MSLAAGEVYWAIRSFHAATPFKIHVADGTPAEVPTASQIVDGLRKGGERGVRVRRVRQGEAGAPPLRSQ